MTKFRDPSKDKLKSSSILKEQTRLNSKCCMPNCNELLSIFDGPGSDVLCRDHQLKLVEYGGAGKLGRLHTLHRKWVCDDCGKDVSVEVAKKYPGLEESDPVKFNRLCRNRIIGDHIIRRADGGDDSADNLQSLCLDCNSDKTILNEDYLKGNRPLVTE